MATLTPTSEDTRVYEIAILYPYPLGQKEESTLLKEVDAVFKEAEAKIIDQDNWGRRGLAYKIGGHQEGTFVIYYLEMDPEKLNTIEETLRITPNLLRHMIVKPPAGYQITKYSEEYESWLKNRETETEKKDREKEEQLKKRVTEKAKRQAKRAETKKAEVTEAQPLEEEKLTEEIDKIISDDELDI